VTAVEHQLAVRKLGRQLTERALDCLCRGHQLEARVGPEFQEVLERLGRLVWEPIIGMEWKEGSEGSSVQKLFRWATGGHSDEEESDEDKQMMISLGHRLQGNRELAAPTAGRVMQQRPKRRTCKLTSLAWAFDILWGNAHHTVNC
jgi:hypothetical protein